MKKSTFRIQSIALLVGSICGAVNYSWAATTINAVSCSQSVVQTAINSASDGDNVIVPVGNCTWSSAVNITNKTITLKGSGSTTGGTKITHGGGDHTLILVSAGTKTGRMDISGFWFAGKSTNWNGTAIQISGPTGWKNLRIHHNLFDGNYPWTINVGVNTHGVIDNNTFKGSAFGIKTYGNGASDWSSTLTLGNADFFFVEDNNFDWDDWYGATGTPCVDMFSGGRVVFRNNTIRNGYFGTHDKARSTLVSANAYEIYNNNISGSDKWKALDITAGTGVIWGNKITGNYSIPIGAMDYKSFDPRGIPLCNGSDPADKNTLGEAGWLCQYQIGSMGSGSTAYQYPLYLWNNTYNGNITNMECTDGCLVNGRPHLLAGRDFINNGTMPKSGYTPYAYPHPLTQTGSTIILAAPVVQIVQ